MEVGCEEVADYKLTHDHVTPLHDICKLAQSKVKTLD